MRIADRGQAYPATTQRFRILSRSYSSSSWFYFIIVIVAKPCFARRQPYTKHRQCVCGSKVQGRVHPEDVSMRNEPRYALEMSQDFKGFLTLWFWLFL